MALELEWLESGRPVVKGAPELGVSLAHDELACLCVAGSGRQGCDMLPVTPRPASEWRGLLGPNAPLLDELGEPLDLAGTRLWTAGEAIRKATTIEDSVELELARRVGDTVLFRGKRDQSHVLTFPLRLTRGAEERVVAVVVAPRAREERQHAPDRRDACGFDPDAYGMRVHEGAGPAGEVVVTFRFPVSFHEASNLSRTVYFSNYTTWMGRFRELGLLPILHQLVEQFATGRFGMVSNYTEARIERAMRGDDVVEARFWAAALNDVTQEINFEWHRLLPGDVTERVAWSRMETSWVAILDHGVVRAQPAEPYFAELLADMAPPPGAVFTRPSLPHSVDDVDLGGLVAAVPPGPINEALLAERIFETSLEDANLVGNLYFANYTYWQGPTRDHHFRDLAPHFFRGIGEHGELRCLYYRIDHLREAMPFDRIGVRMSIDSLHERGVRLKFDYFRVPEDDGGWQKLGTGQHWAGWFVPPGSGNQSDEWEPADLPEVFREPLLATITQ